ncbi:MAG: rhomboid family intramembrane serine protease [Armatimonadetes bacterium]|nr:rhomboid family intramembrane serine protease [Armatimonadota bacterium]
MTCPRCAGTGVCAECKGEGSLKCPNCEGSGRSTRTSGGTISCSRCKGSGREACNPRCDSCLGSGEITTEQQKDIAEKYALKGAPIAERVSFGATQTLVAILLLVFVLQGQFPEIGKMGAFYGPLAFHGEWWRLVTAQFIHGGFIHVGMNAWFLFTTGPALEGMIGSTRFVAVFLLCGIVGFLFSGWFGHNPSVGASGALFGIGGMLVGLHWRWHLFTNDSIRPFFIWMVVWMAYGFLAPGMRIDNWAHLGGGLSGLSIAYLIPRGWISSA